MRYEAQITFAGQVAMRKGEVRELDRSVASPLVKCGYLKEKRAVKPKENKRNNAGSDI